MLVINLSQIEKIEILETKTKIHFVSGGYHYLEGNDQKDFLKTIKLRNSFVEVGTDKLGLKIKEKKNGH